MSKLRKPSPHIPLPQALLWIVGSTLITSGSFHLWLSKDVTPTSADKKRKVEFVTTMIQTGPQKEALRSEYLAELVGLSVDNPVRASAFDVEDAKKALTESPLIADAHVKVIAPSTVYIDYTVRQPIAWLYDFENTGLDKDGFPLPMYPFFPPKNLPEIYLGHDGFLEPGQTSARLVWNRPLSGTRYELAFDLLRRLQPLAKELFRIKRIDVSRSEAESLGKREIVIALENPLPQPRGQEPLISLHWLRLSVKNYPKELGNYLELRKKLLEEDLLSFQASAYMPLQKVIDLRLTKLAYIKEVGEDK